MKLYKDQNLNEEVTELDFGTIPAGESKEYSFFVLNDNGTFVQNLKFSVDNDEVEIVKAPTALKNKESAEILFKWNSSLKVKQGLKAELDINGEEIWG
jgi:hypothetical protein